MKIQFLLFSDGASHKLLGINPVRGLESLGIDVALYWVRHREGKLVFDSDYVFCLKPRLDSDELTLNFKNSKKCLIINDEHLEENRLYVYDFAVSPSHEWMTTYSLPTFLIKEEFDFCKYKKHKDGSRIVTFGYKENLINHLTPVLPYFVGEDLTIISNFEDSFTLPDIFYKFQLRKFSVPNVHSKEYDEVLIRQFDKYDVGLVTQYENSGRTSNRIKALLYSGLPVIASKNNENLWFNEYKIRLSLVHGNEWKEKLDEMKNRDLRQEITDFNFSLIKSNYGIKQSANSFLDAIKKFEQEN